MNNIPRLKFAQLPTTIEEMPRLSKKLGGPRLLVKRDDQTGLAFGGNKTRKLEFLVADAQSQRADLLITAGAVQSNHCRQTAAAAARFGFDCKLVLFGDVPALPDANLWLDQLFGAEIIYTERARRDEMLEQVSEKAKKEGKKPYIVPYGGSNPIGAMGYVFAMQELIAQIETVDCVVFPSSSGGTQAGLVVGAVQFGYKGQVLGISVDEPRQVLQENVARLAGETSRRLGSPFDFSADEVLVNADYCAVGYGVLTPAEVESVRMFATMEGLLLDPVYTGRAAAGLIDLIRKGFFNTTETVLFWHTGGTPALFASKYSGITNKSSAKL
ncbi:MAG: pyridoxal-5'-phosphate-dependent protein [Chloroflexi bacterium RBG_16_51_16]|nr:MAG: pyridoxal-5'-phosphate-dependent protein [Chloroflexi bacterium RBG_16_51_16]